MEWIPGHIYIIKTRIPPQQIPREHCLTYLGSTSRGELQFSGRPNYGTQKFILDRILTSQDLGPAEGENDARHYMNRRRP